MANACWSWTTTRDALNLDGAVDGTGLCRAGSHSGSAYAAFDDTVTRPDIVSLDLHLPDSQDVTTLSSVRVRAPSAKGVLMSAFLTPEIGP